MACVFFYFAARPLVLFDASSVCVCVGGGQMSKTEGNFLAVGGTLGFAVAAFGRAFLTSKR